MPGLLTIESPTRAAKPERGWTRPTIPWGIASFRMASYAVWPFGRELVDKPNSGIFSFLGKALLEEAGISSVVVEYLAMPVFLGGPQVVPPSPEALVAEVHREEPVEMRQPLLGEEVESESGTRVVGDSLRLVPELRLELVRGAGADLHPQAPPL